MTVRATLPMPGLFGASRFTTELETQQHCPYDVVVWVNLLTDVYHRRGQRLYRNTKGGVYECRREADHERSRLTHNGQ